MTNALRTPLVLGLALTLFGFTSACDNGEDEAGETMSETTTGDGDGDGDATTETDTDPTDTEDTSDTTGECVEQPPECALFVGCISALVPSQAETVEEQYGADGSCWCGSADDANECYTTCLEQVETALSNQNGQLEPACHENSCGIEELDTTQPYGPLVDGACPDYEGPQGDPIEQLAFESPFGVPGSFCSPKCSGLANFCPDHTQTTADGTCFISQGEDSYCIARCWVDPSIIGGTQCPCGARCQPQGAPDGEGNMRGLCTFE